MVFLDVFLRGIFVYSVSLVRGGNVEKNPYYILACKILGRRVYEQKSLGSQHKRLVRHALLRGAFFGKNASACYSVLDLLGAKLASYSSRFSSMIRRISSDMVMPSSLARLPSHEYWGLVKVTVCLICAMWCHVAPHYQLVKELA
jgi:hypothetical protein